MTPTPTRLNIAEAAAHLGVSQRYLYQMCRDRKIRHERIGGRTIIRFLLADLEAFLASRVVEPLEGPTPAPAARRPPPAKVSRVLAGGVDYFAPQGARKTRRPAGGNAAR